MDLLSSEDVLILGCLQNDKSVGIYSSATKIVSFVTGIGTFITVAILPLLARLFLESREQLIEASERILRYLILAGLPIAVGMAMTSGKAIDLLYPQSFRDAAIVLTVTSWSVALGFIQIVFAALLTAMDRQKEKMIATAVNLAVATALYVILIRQFDIIGASVAKVIATAVGLVLYSHLVSKYLKRLPIIRAVIKPTLACLAMAIFIHYFDAWNLFYLILAACAVYAVVLLGLGEIRQDEVKYLKRLLPKTIYGG